MEPAFQPSAARAAAYPLELALARLRTRAGRTAAIALGIAVGAATLAVATGGSVAVQDRSVQRSFAELTPSDRAVQAVWSGVPAQSDLSEAALNRAATQTMREVTGETPAVVMLFREANYGDAVITLGAVDRLRQWVVLRSGRLPQSCSASRCELLQIGGAGRLPHSPLLKVVGDGVLRDASPFAAYFSARPRGQTPILVANGVTGLRRLPLPDADLIARTYGWIVPITPRSLHEWELDAFRGRVDRASSQLGVRNELFSITAPLERLGEIHDRARVAGRRLLLVGGDVALLLFGFVVFAATRTRRDSEAVERRLTWLGARRSHILLLTLAESAGIAAVSVAVGWAAGALGAAAFARHLGADARAVVLHSVLSGRGLAVAGAVALSAALVVTLALRVRLRVAGGFTVLDACALGAVGAVALALARGSANAGELAARGGTGVVLLLLPGLIVIASAAVLARAITPLLLGLQRAARTHSPRFRLAALSLARDPGRSRVAAVFIAVSVGLAVFAAVYRSTLIRNQTEQAAFEVPADYVLSEDLGRLVTVQQAAAPGEYARLGTATPVFRSGGNVVGRGGLSFTLVGLPAGGLTTLDGWRDDFADVSRSKLAAALAGGHGGLRGARIPVDARTLDLPVRVAGQPVGLTLNVLNTRGDFTTLQLGELHSGSAVHRIAVPRAARGGRIVAVRVTYPSVAAFLAGHRESGTTLSVSNASRGTLELGGIRAETAGGAKEIGGYRGWVGIDGIRVEEAGATARVGYTVNRAANSLFRPALPNEGEPVPVLASPRLAAAAGPRGLLALDIGGQPLTARVTGVVRYFPTVEGDAVVADRDRVTTALNGRRPGVAVPGEVWLDTPRGAAAALGRPPFDALDVVSHQAVADRLRGDPLSRGSLALVTAAAAAALALALVGLLLIVVGDVRDESGELFDLELQGAAPVDIRAHLRLRSALLAAVGTAGGILIGLVLSALVVDVVTVTAGATAAVPPLRLELDWLLLGGGLVAFAAAAGAVAAIAAAPAYRLVARRRWSEGLS